MARACAPHTAPLTLTTTANFDYNPDGQLTRESVGYLTQPNGADVQTDVRYDYNAFGPFARNLTKMSLQQRDTNNTLTTLLSATYGYEDGDNSGRLQSLLGQAGTPSGTLTTSSSSFTYVPGTDVVQTVTTGDLHTRYIYEPASGLLKTLVVARDGDILADGSITGGGVLVYKAAYDYPVFHSAALAHGRQISRVDVTRRLPGGSTDQYSVSYDYDTLDQLTSVTTSGSPTGPAPANENFHFDAIGNRTGADGYTSNALNQYTAGPGNVAFDYDSDGNLKRDGDPNTYTSMRFTYDALDRLIEAHPEGVISTSQDVRYTYDAQNRLTSRRVYGFDVNTNTWNNAPSEFTQYVWDGSDLIAEFNGYTGQMIRSYTWDPRGTAGAGLLSLKTYDATGNVSHIYDAFKDGNYNLMGLIDTTPGSSTYGQVVQTYTYSAFGVRTAANPDNDVCPIGFDMYLYDQVTRVYLTPSARIYSAYLARFLQRDPTGEDNSINLYAIDGNDPINNVDPMGLADISSWSSQRLNAINSELARWSSVRPDAPNARYAALRVSELEAEKALMSDAPWRAAKERWNFLTRRQQGIQDDREYIKECAWIIVPGGPFYWRTPAQVAASERLVEEDKRLDAERVDLEHEFPGVWKAGFISGTVQAYDTPLEMTLQQAAFNFIAAGAAIAQGNAASAARYQTMAADRFAERQMVWNAPLDAPRSGLPRYWVSPTFQRMLLNRYQIYSDEAFANVDRARAADLLRPPKGIPMETYMGQLVDRGVQVRIRTWLESMNVPEGPGEAVQLNRRLYDPLGSSQYRVPDLRIPSAGLTIDGTLGSKDLRTPQIIDFSRFSGGDRIIIVRPAQRGGSYGVIGP